MYRVKAITAGLIGALTLPLAASCAGGTRFEGEYDAAVGLAARCFSKGSIDIATAYQRAVLISDIEGGSFDLFGLSSIDSDAVSHTSCRRGVVTSPKRLDVLHVNDLFEQVAGLSGARQQSVVTVGGLQLDLFVDGRTAGSFVVPSIVLEANRLVNVLRPLAEHQD